MEAAEHQIQLLIERFDFEALSPTDRKFVLMHLDEESYRQKRAVIRESLDLFAEETDAMVPNPLMKERLQAAMNQQRNTAPWWQLFQYRIPAYQVGLAVLPLLLLLIFWRPQPEVQLVEQEKLVVQRDTVYVDREVEVPKIEVKRVLVKQIEYVQGAPDVAYEPPPRVEREPLDDRHNPYAMEEEERQEHLQQSFGNTSFEKDVLDVLLVQVD